MERAPPAVQPPSWALPTAAFHVGLCAVVILVGVVGFPSGCGALDANKKLLCTF